MKLIIIANRLPLKVIEEEDSYRMIPSHGGLTTGLDSLETPLEKHWIGWPGMYLDDPEAISQIDAQLYNLQFHPVHLRPEQIENYYEGYCNNVLWPLCHYFPSYIQSESDYWNTYAEVNALFCDAALRLIEPGDIVWVHDYHLMLLPRMIRNRMPDVSIGYFHHIPFPSYELFRTLAERADLLNGLLGADLIGFHTHSYQVHFTNAVYRVLKLECVMDEIQIDHRLVTISAFPMGINYEKYHDALRNFPLRRKARKLRASFGEGKLILSVDRLDYSKGILIRLKSFEHFLHNNPGYHGKVSLVMVLAPSRDNVPQYAELKEAIDRTVGFINGQYSTMSWRPIYYFYRSLPFDELVQFYHIADIAMVTPLRDGMNLVAKEYLATKRKQPGVLILSEMAGAADELSDALIVNPTSSHEIEAAIITALEMPESEQLKSLAAMQKIIATQSVGKWAEDFVAALQNIKQVNRRLQEKIIDENLSATIRRQYDAANSRLLLLDYDGTLVPFHKSPQGAIPPPSLLALLTRLAGDQGNHVVVCSGRDRHTLEAWLGKLPIGLAAEHGALHKENGTWHRKIHKSQWDDEIINIMKLIVKKTPGSQLEIKDTALVWHYRNVGPWLVQSRVAQLINLLVAPCFRHQLQIMKGNKIIEIKPFGIGKGDEAVRLVNKGQYDFILAIGDDTTDEDMFRALPADAITIKVGKHSAAARYHLPMQEQAVDFLRQLCL